MNQNIPVDGIINFKCIETTKLKVFYVKWSHSSHRLKLKKRVLQLATTSELSNVHKLLELQLERLRESRPKKLLLFVNPYGGKGKALQVFKQTVKPLLELAQIDFKLIVTQYANHARDMIEDGAFEIDQFDGLVGLILDIWLQ